MAKEQPLKHNKKKSKSKKVRKEKVDEVDPIGLLRKLTNTAKSKTVCLPHKIFYDLILYYHSMICSVIFFFIFLDFWRSWDVRNPPWCPARKPSESGTLLNFLLQCRYNIIDVLFVIIDSMHLVIPWIFQNVQTELLSLCIYMYKFLHKLWTSFGNAIFIS